MSFVGIHCFIPVRERLLQGNGSKQSQRPPKRMARSDNRITWMRRNLLPNNRKHLDNDRVPSVKIEYCRSVAVWAKKGHNLSRKKEAAVYTRSGCGKGSAVIDWWQQKNLRGNLTPGQTNGTKSTWESARILAMDPLHIQVNFKKQKKN